MHNLSFLRRDGRAASCSALCLRAPGRRGFIFSSISAPPPCYGLRATCVPSRRAAESQVAEFGSA
eukprot:scaffold7694_cov116-Isochrysis_galbana.AAC.5